MKNKNLPYLIIVIVLFLIIAKVGINQYKDRKIVLEDYQIDTAIMVDYYEVGDTRNAKVEYYFEIDNIPYIRTVSFNYYFPECVDDISACKDKRFWVIYSKKDPTKNLINLKIEIQDSLKHSFPEDLDDFR